MEQFYWNTQTSFPAFGPIVKSILWEVNLTEYQREWIEYNVWEAVRDGKILTKTLLRQRVKDRIKDAYRQNDTRRRKHDLIKQTQARQADTYDDIYGEEAKRLIVEALASLSPDCQGRIRGRHIEFRSAKEMAEEEGVDVNVFRNKTWKCMNHLRSWFKEKNITMRELV